ncbi:tetratricopeptide repeat protein [Chroogloeocystis siderophila]|jgi:tetratricopeptide (TPR) repeat protein|uniref:Uncharacterized protein n=1 Tax=Chroogloeocystis siderophila 5.2 s.c.1 TaxID=247279 RepID=A0A1U7HK27_9CHRO|nr:tetratricopeptide repeat protein [Chroogloeocystis siderophila]OKH23919.1 hypothetical protein NIES1031_16615 [Chroogloeocystis siderophila 5.2 s.c.1]
MRLAQIMTISGIVALVVTVGEGIAAAQTDNFRCFMVTMSGNTINLEHICKVNNDLGSKKLVNLTPIYTQIRQNLDNQNFEEAIEGYTQLLRYQPNNAKVYLNRGLIYWYLDNRQTAIADLEQASRLFRAQGDETYFPATQELIRQIQSEG